MMEGKWAVLISGNGSNLQTLLDEKNISVVIASNTKAYGILRARRAGIPVEIAVNESEILALISKYNIKNVFLAGYMKIVSANFINEISKSGVVLNIHPSLLPKYKGLKAFESALDSCENVFGVTVHHVVAEVDSGAFVLQGKFSIPDDKNLENSKLFLHINEQKILRDSIRKYQ